MRPWSPPTDPSEVDREGPSSTKAEGPGVAFPVLLLFVTYADAKLLPCEAELPLSPVGTPCWAPPVTVRWPIS